MATPPVVLSKLRALHAQLTNEGIRYGLGAKARTMDASPSSISRIDCSGLVRYEVINCTSPRINFPDGSWIQREWCENHLKEVPYSTAGNADDNRLFIAFMTAGVRGVGRVGHVWLVNRGRTMESYGGHGVGSHEWDAYSRRVHKCFEWPTVAQPTAAKPAEPHETVILVNGTRVAHVNAENVKGRIRGEIAPVVAALGHTFKYDPVNDTLSIT